MKSRYWSCTKFADWLRGTPKIEAGTGDEWRSWEDHAKTAHPIRWWLAEEGLDKIQNFVYWPITKLYDIKYYINNRWVSKTHALTAHPKDIKRGEWCDLSSRFLPCLFNELVDFVEVELAWWHIAWEGKNERRKYKPPFWATGWWRWRVWRCPQAGLDNLQWQCNLVWEKEHLREGSPDVGKPTPQAVTAKEILELYKWWTEVYPNRPDPYDVSGWSQYCKLVREEKGGSWLPLESSNPKTKKLGDQAHKKLHKLETQYKKEEEEMMIRLIRIRDHLWT